MNEQEYRASIEQEINRRIEEKLSNSTIKDGQIYLLTDKRCPSCFELKSRPEVRNQIDSGDIIVLDGESDLKTQIESELHLLSYPSWAVYSVEYGFLTEDRWKEIQQKEEKQGKEVTAMNIAIVVDSDLRVVMSELLDGYINDGVVKLIDKTELPKKDRKTELPAGYVNGKLYPVEIGDAIAIKRNDDDDIVFEVED